MFAPLLRLSWRFWVGLIILSSLFSGFDSAQTSSSGALGGVAFDPSNAVLPGVSIQVQKESGGEVKSTFSDENGRFVIQLLPPGTYQLQASKTNFRTLTLSNLHIYVTETLRLDLHLQVADMSNVQRYPPARKCSKPAIRFWDAS
jgi:hypothetical protein